MCVLGRLGECGSVRLVGKHAQMTRASAPCEMAWEFQDIVWNTRRSRSCVMVCGGYHHCLAVRVLLAELDKLLGTHIRAITEI